MCIFYFLGIFNGLVLETLHEVSHLFAPKTHSHSYAFGPEIVNYASLEGMAGHSHEALKELKELLEANKPSKKEDEIASKLKIDKHITKDFALKINHGFLVKRKTNWNYNLRSFLWYPSINIPPPQHI